MINSKNSNTFKSNSLEERTKRLHILVDLIFSYHKHLKGDFYHSRISDVILWDDMLEVGKDKTLGIKLHKEHVVPLAYLFAESFKIMKDDKNEEEKRNLIFELLDRCLMILAIDKSKADLLDSVKNGGLDLRTKMPKDWDLFNGDPFARIKLAYKHDYDKIEFYK